MHASQLELYTITYFD